MKSLGMAQAFSYFVATACIQSGRRPLLLSQKAGIHAYFYDCLAGATPREFALGIQPD
jgi:hypothetical protein